MNAQKCAVLEFRGARSISITSIDGISEMFMTYFRPTGYTMVERAQIDKVISEQGFQRSDITDEQAVRVGRILNVSKVVLGKVSMLGGQYQVDVRVVDVESGHDVATEGATFTGDYRTNVRNLATNLAGKIAITPGSTVRVQPAPKQDGPKKRSSVEILYGYLKIFPNELGTFEAEPTTIIAQINKQAQHGYNNWRIPTNEELALMRANNYLGNGSYMTKENKKGIVLLVTDGENYTTIQQAEEQKRKVSQEAERVRKQRIAELKAQGWIDLGLPSGTLWKDRNEGSEVYEHQQSDSEKSNRIKKKGIGREKLFSLDEARVKFRDNLPTKEQLKELKTYCNWIWMGSGYKVEGPSGEIITLPADGQETDFYDIQGVGSYGSYWSSTTDGPYRQYGWVLGFSYSEVTIGTSQIWRKQSVRLVRKSSEN